MAHGLFGLWGFPGPGVEPVSPALQSGFLTTRLPGKPYEVIFNERAFTSVKLFFLIS